jgi:hypothetical protein
MGVQGTSLGGVRKPAAPAPVVSQVPSCYTLFQRDLAAARPAPAAAPLSQQQQAMYVLAPSPTPPVGPAWASPMQGGRVWAVRFGFIGLGVWGPTPLTHCTQHP